MKRSIIYGSLAVVFALVVTILATTSRKTETTSTKTTVEPVASVQLEEVTQSSVISPKVTASATVSETLNVKLITVSEDDIVYFNAPVFDESVDAAISMLENIKGSKAYLVIHSPGGSVVSGARLLEYMKNTKKEIVTVCDNLCASMAFQIFQMGKTRQMTESAIIMAHPASGGAQGTLENMFEMIKAFKLYVDRMDAAVAQRSGIEYTKFKALVADNIWVQTPEALKSGLADEVVHLNVKKSPMGGFLFKSDAENNVLKQLRKRNLITPEKMALKGYQF